VVVGRRERRELGGREVARAEFDDVLADEDGRLPVIDFREPGGIESQTDRNTLVREPVVFALRLRIRFEDRSAIADDADWHARGEAVRDRDGNGVLAQI